MTHAKDIEQFIHISSNIFKAFPSSALISIKYANESKKKKSNSSIPKQYVTFKCYEPNSGRCIKLKTNKTKEVSRILTFLGPNGVTVTRATKRHASSNNEAEGSAKRRKDDSGSVSTHTAGIASLMSNVKFEEADTNPEVTKATNESPEEEKVVEANLPKDKVSTTNTEATGGSKNKKKKKKGKK